VVIQTHRGDRPVRYHNFMIRDSKWKLLHNSGFQHEALHEPLRFELYDLENDQTEANDLAKSHPEIVERLKAEYDRWFDDVSSTRTDNYAPPRIIIGSQFEKRTTLTRQDWRAKDWNNRSTGSWLLDVAEPGTYQIEVNFNKLPQPGQATLKLGGKESTVALATDSARHEFTLDLPSGETELEFAIQMSGTQQGAYQVHVERH
jgi:hypothetical protein